MATQADVARSDSIGLITVLRPRGTARRELLAVPRGRRPSRLSGSSARVQDVSRCTIAASEHGYKWGESIGGSSIGVPHGAKWVIFVSVLLCTYTPPSTYLCLVHTALPFDGLRDAPAAEAPDRYMLLEDCPAKTAFGQCPGHVIQCLQLSEWPYSCPGCQQTPVWIPYCRVAQARCPTTEIEPVYSVGPGHGCASENFRVFRCFAPQPMRNLDVLFHQRRSAQAYTDTGPSGPPHSCGFAHASRL